MIRKIIIQTDGGSRGNPGPAGSGYVLRDVNGGKILARGHFLGETTNNVAEYTGLLKALEGAKELAAETVEIYCDSELLVKQINGQYKVKSENLKDLYNRCMDLLQDFKSWKIRHILRDKNKEADRMANLAMDKKGDVEEVFEMPGADVEPVRLAVLLSGGGTTMVNIQKQIDAGKLPAKIVVVISSRSKVKGIERSRKIGLEPVIIRKKDFPDVDSFSSRISDVLEQNKVDLVIQAGWLCLWKIPDKFENRVMNIHPALLPSFGGQGMWGHHVHEAVLASGCKVSGCTVHFANNEYDSGPIIVQLTCPVEEGDDAEALAERVFAQECIAYPTAIKLFAEGRLKVEGGVVRIG